MTIDKSNKSFNVILIFCLIYVFLPNFSSAQVPITLRNPLDSLAPGYLLGNLFDNDKLENNGKKTLYYCKNFDVTPGGTADGHGGTDFPVKTGTPVFLAYAGRVYKISNEICEDVGFVGSKCGDGFGNHYRIDHQGDTSDGQGLVSIYAHLTKDSRWFSVGTALSCGRQIGFSASSGSSSASHLHFEIRSNGIDRSTRLDPFIGACSHSTPPSWTTVSNNNPTNDCDLRPLVPSRGLVKNPNYTSLRVSYQDEALDYESTTHERRYENGDWITISGRTGTGAYFYAWTNIDLEPATNYCYRFKASNEYGDLGYSKQACGKTLGSIGVLPAVSNASVTRPTIDSLRVNFTDNAANDTSTIMERKVGSGNWNHYVSFTANPGTKRWYWIDKGVISKKKYCYRFRAVKNTLGTSVYSNEACGTTL